MNDHVNNRQIAFILFGVQVGYGVLGLPKDAAEQAGTGSWVAILIATLMAILSINIITYINYTYKNKTIYEYSELLLGKYMKAIIIAVYIIHYFIVLCMITRLVSEAIKQTILLKTPVWVLSMIIFLIMYFTIIKGIKVIARLCELYGVVIIFTALFIHLLLFTQGELINLKPFFVIERIPTYLKASMALIFPFLGMELLVVIPFGKDNKKKVFYYVTGMSFFVGILYMIIAESSIGIVGADSIIYYDDALLATIRRTEIPFLQFLQRLDGIFMIAWIMAVFTTLTLHAYGAVFLLSKCFKKIKFQFVGMIVIIIGFGVSQMPRTIEDVQKILESTNYTGVLTAGVIPLILYIVTKVRKHDKKAV